MAAFNRILHKDDRDAIITKIHWADGVIFVSPVYALNVSSLMKNFMERIAYFSHRPAFLGKPAMLVTTTAGPGTASTLKALSWFSIMGFEIASKLGEVVYPAHENILSYQKAVDGRIRKAVGKFDKALHKSPARPSLIRVIQFHALKANAMFGKSFYTADYDYYKEKKTYHTAVSVSWWKQLFGKFIFWMSSQWMKRNFVPGREEGNSTRRN